MATPTRKAQVFLDPTWLQRTAALAVERGTAIVFSPKHVVYGILPKSSGSVNVYYPADESWMNEILKIYPDGAVFPAEGGFLGGPAAVRALRPYSKIQLGDGDRSDTCWIDPITGTVRVKGKSATIKSAAFDECKSDVYLPPTEIEKFELDENVTEGVADLLNECAGHDESRPQYKRIAVYVGKDGRSFLGATNGRVAVAHWAEGLNEDFSYDPAVVRLLDIVSFENIKLQDGTSVIRNYRLRNGIVVSEKTNLTNGPSMKEIFSNGAKEEKSLLISAFSLSSVLDEIKEIGITLKDKFGGVLDFGPSDTKLIVDEATVAEFTTTAERDAPSAQFAYPYLALVHKLGGDLTCSADGRRGWCSTGSTSMLIAGITKMKVQ